MILRVGFGRMREVSPSFYVGGGNLWNAIIQLPWTDRLQAILFGSVLGCEAAAAGGIDRP